jgi:hypothetical protein
VGGAGLCDGHGRELPKMKTASKLFVGLSMVLVVGVLARADEKKEEVTLKGTITCAKCDLKLEKKCATVIKVKKDDKEIIYYFDADGHKKNHPTICQEAKEGSVTGTTAEKDGKHWITVSKIEYSK